MPVISCSRLPHLQSNNMSWLDPLAGETRADVDEIYGPTPHNPLQDHVRFRFTHKISSGRGSVRAAGVDGYTQNNLLVVCVGSPAPLLTHPFTHFSDRYIFSFKTMFLQVRPMSRVPSVSDRRTMSENWVVIP